MQLKAADLGFSGRRGYQREENLGLAFSENLHTHSHTHTPSLCAVGVPAWQRPQHKED